MGVAGHLIVAWGNSTPGITQVATRPRLSQAARGGAHARTSCPLIFTPFPASIRIERVLQKMVPLRKCFMPVDPRRDTRATKA